MLKGENSILLMSANPEPECVDMQNLTELSMISTSITYIPASGVMQESQILRSYIPINRSSNTVKWNG